MVQPNAARVLFLVTVLAHWCLSLITIALLRTGFLPDVSWFLGTATGSFVLATLTLVLYAVSSFVKMNLLRRLCQLSLFLAVLLSVASVIHEATLLRLAGPTVKQTPLPLVNSVLSACMTITALASLYASGT